MASTDFSLLVIDKPSGPTSFKVSQYIKNELKLTKTSHMGTLDPMVTGVLPITLNRACKLSKYFMHSDKEYVGIMRLHEGISDNKLKETIFSFLGKIIQLPPVRSRVARREREREIKSFKILERDGKDVLFLADVQAGTYIRKLIHDIGEKIGGAHMLELRRTRASIFQEKNAITLYEFDKIKSSQKELDKHLIPAEQAIKKVLPIVQISNKNLKQILTGKPLHKSDLISELPKEETFAAFAKERFIGVYNKVNEKDIVARAEFVYN